MDFKRQPLIDDFIFLFQLFDNTFADIAKGSDVVGIYCNINWVHCSLLDSDLKFFFTVLTI